MPQTLDHNPSGSGFESLEDCDSQTSVIEKPRDTASSYRPEGYNEFNYRPVPVIAVVGFVLSILSSIAILMWIAMPLCIVGFLISTLALIMIRRSAGVYSGKFIAMTGMLISVASLSGGIAYQRNLYQNEVPEGFERISFVNDISDKGFITQNGFNTIHPDVQALDGKDVFVKGYIYQTGKLVDLQSFLFVKDNQSCCFGANPAITDQIGVVMDEGKAIDYKAGKVAVAGTFRINPKFDGQDGTPLYVLDGSYFTSQVSDF